MFTRLATSLRAMKSSESFLVTWNRTSSEPRSLRERVLPPIRTSLSQRMGSAPHQNHAVSENGFCSSSEPQSLRTGSAARLISHLVTFQKPETPCEPIISLIHLIVYLVSIIYQSHHEEEQSRGYGEVFHLKQVAPP